MSKKTKALVLMSGGLDSMLAAKILAELGVEVVPVCFTSYFFSFGKARKAAETIGMGLRVEDISKIHLEIVKNPRYGHGSAINPCIDCHLLMLKTARKIMEAEGFDFVATGEVLGERPMSQNKQSLDTIERESGLVGKLLRPLSAKLMPPTVAESQDLIDRNKLYDISGRSRKIQMELAHKFLIDYIPQPGGGCVLTEKEFGQRLGQLMAKYPDFDGSDAQILRHCRPIWEGNLLIAVARNGENCEALKGLAKTGDVVFEPENFPGPVVLARDFGKTGEKEKTEFLGKKYLLQYSKKIPNEPKISIKIIP